MKTIWKYELEPSAFISMPKGAQILHIDSPDDVSICLWALVDDAQEREVREFRVYGTGHNLPDEADNWTHIGTALLRKYALVWHVFETEQTITS